MSDKKIKQHESIKSDANGNVKVNGRSTKSIAKEVNKQYFWADEANADTVQRGPNLNQTNLARCISFAIFTDAKEAAADRRLIESYSK